ncbi:MAG: tetratricopeptide repeat protein [Magnetococcales bacterium]|nr:tetratricopeptide repeat protein [Magnetococcales bacterium]
MESPNQTVTLDEALQIGLKHHQAGEHQQAESIYRQILAVEPTQIEALHLMGILASQNNQLEMAERYFQQALAINPEMAQVHANLANLLYTQQRFDEAKEHYQCSVEINPNNPLFLEHYALLLMEQGILDEAEPLMRRLITLQPDRADHHNNLGSLLVTKEDFSEAEACYQKALQLAPEQYGYLMNTGLMYMKKGAPNKALPLYLNGAKLKPDHENTSISLGRAYHELGRFQEAQAVYKNYLSRHSKAHHTHSNLIITLDHTPNLDDADIQSERRRWGAQFDAMTQPHHDNTPDPERRLRIGYVSGYFCDHSAANAFAAPILHHDPTQFELFLYSTAKSSQTDPATQQFMAASGNNWRDVAQLDQPQLEALIRQDRIDILLDLTGHAVNHRLTVFARRPAPVQITAWGWQHGTGLTAMDYMFTDLISLPKAKAHLWSETPYYLPTGVHLLNFNSMPDVGPLPALTNGHLTLGALSRPDKISEQSISLWANLLHAIPKSHFILKISCPIEDYFGGTFLEHFKQAGIDPKRIRIEGKTDQWRHLQVLNEIDFQLDSHPVCSSVSGLESLRMGVPVLTRISDRFSSRHMATYNHLVGADDWVVTNDAEFVRVGQQMGKKLEELAQLRGTLRQRFDNSLLGDHDAFARVVEKAYRDIWRRWCDKTDQP